MRLEDIREGQRLGGVIPNATVSVIAAQNHGADAVEVEIDGLGRQRQTFRAWEPRA